MRIFYSDELFDAHLVRTLSHCCYGGADLAECLAAAHRIPEKDTERWFEVWMELAGRIQADGERSQRQGHRVSARSCFLRASNYYRNAYIFLFGPAPDARLRHAYDLHRQCFHQAAELMDCFVEEVRIPYEQTTLPGYFLRNGSDTPGPTLILNGGYDSTAEECYFWNAVAGLQRGYNCFLFDGPGQGSALLEQGLTFRPDWESVLRPVTDWLLSRPEVDSRRIAIMGLSFGGYLALRAASGEPRLAACVADPGELSMLAILRARLPAFLGRDLPVPGGISSWLLGTLLRRRVKDPTAGWVLRRGLWVHGASSIEEYFRLLAEYSIEGRAERIECPTLICSAEDDEVAVTARQVYDALRCTKQFLDFRRSEGAGEHCETGARLLFHQRAFNWLDELLQVG